ncbi:MAG: lauroyl acyltransferase [Magnetospirillum sp.]|nr:lauroyl acyltransferase [Magnetospirillum sp.]
MSLSRSLRWRIEALGARAVFGLFAMLPVDWASALGGLLARVVGPRLRVSEIARTNLRRAFPDMPASRVEAVVGEVWDNLGRVAGEFPHIHWLIRNRVEAVNLHHLHEMRDDGRPGIFISAHFGNWELGGAMACRENLPITLVYRAANNPGVETLYRRGRGAAAEGGQIPKGSPGARQAIEVLCRGGHLAMLVDQKMNDGIPVPFFGRDAMTAPAMARFALKYRCPVVPAKIERLKGAHFRMTFYPPIPLPDSGDAHRDTLEVMTRVNALIEEWVRACPGQWLWLHKRWPD